MSEKLVFEDTLLALVQVYQANEEMARSDAVGKKLVTLLKRIAHQITFYAKMQTSISRRDLEKQMVCQCLENISKYNPKKGKAFNYFTTIMLNYLRKEYRIWRNRIDLNKKYECVFDKKRKIS